MILELRLTISVIRNSKIVNRKYKIMKKVLFIDRDGTMILEPADYQVDSFSKLEFYPEAFTYLGKIAKELDYELSLIHI